METAARSSAGRRYLVRSILSSEIAVHRLDFLDAGILKFSLSQFSEPVKPDARRLRDLAQWRAVRRSEQIECLGE